MKLRKLMWISLLVEIVSLLILVLLLLLQKTIPDILLGIFIVSMIVTFTSSICVQRIKSKNENNGSIFNA